MLNDITRCHGVGCSIRSQCLRHVAPVPDGALLSWAQNLNHDHAHVCAYLLPKRNVDSGLSWVQS